MRRPILLVLQHRVSCMLSASVGVCYHQCQCSFGRRNIWLRAAHACEYRLVEMAADNLTAVLYKVNDLRLVSDFVKFTEL
jgi:hypothetical protein